MSQSTLSPNSSCIWSPTLADSDYCAVYVRNLVKCYDGGPATLNNLNMTVKKGNIYGLLGSSGCGKTTILSCIVGLQRWDDGELLVFGQRPGIHLATKLGYMPQDVSLYDQLTIFEIIQFYGKLYKLSEKQVRERWHLLFTLLEFPKELQFVRDLSGGQRRRASLALALIHNPKLLLLDEPTVGLDPLLREKIWNYLTTIAKSQNTTIIITTHYMEEARFCDTIGIMRKGQIITEETPAKLLGRYNCELLEKAVLSLCREHETFVGKKTLDKVKHNYATHVEPKSNSYSYKLKEFDCELNESHDHSNVQTKPSVKSMGTDRRLRFVDDVHHSLQKVNALTKVMALTIIRHRVYVIVETKFLAILLFMPTIQCWLALATIGCRVKDIHFGVVNHDLINWKSQCKNQTYTENPCKYMSMCGLLNRIEEDNLLILKDYETEETALKHVQLGHTWGYFSIPANHSTNILDFATHRHFSSNETLEGSRIRIRVDHSQYLTAFFILKNVYNAYINHSMQLAQICGMSRSFELPINYRPAVYGDYTDNFTDFVLPGVLLMSTGLISVMLSALLFATDFQQNTLTRAHVAGLKITDIICSHVIIQSAITLAQTGVLTGILYFAFDFRIHGYESQLLYVLLCVITGLIAAPFGLLLGILCKDEVTTLIFGIFLTPNFLLWGGIVLPTETATWFWQQIGYLIPLKVPVAVLRSVLTRGLGITHPLVWTVFMASSIWIFGLVTGIIIMFRTLKL